MKRILFVCLGNICRSPMAEYVMKHEVKNRKLDDQFEIASCATSYCEQGSDVHHGTKRVLARHDIPCPPRKARRIQKEDYGYYDLILAMDESNLDDILSIIGKDVCHKVRMLLPYSVADPWYTGDFETTYRDICRGVSLLLETLPKGENL